MRPRRLESQLVDAVVEAGTLVLNVSSKLRAQFAFYAGAKARLRCGRRSVPLVLEKRARGVGLALRIIVTPDDVLAVTEAGGGAAVVEVAVQLGPLRWAGTVWCFDPDPLPPVLELGGDRWAVTGLFDEASYDVAIRVVERVAVAEAQKRDDGFALTLNRPGVRLAVRRPGGSVVEVAASGSEVVLDAASLLRGEASDNPVSGASFRAVEVPGVGDGRLYLARRPGAVTLDGTVLRLAPSDQGWAELIIDRDLDAHVTARRLKPNPDERRPGRDFR